jgi:hypothetical protein
VPLHAPKYPFEEGKETSVYKSIERLGKLDPKIVRSLGILDEGCAALPDDVEKTKKTAQDAGVIILTNNPRLSL